MRLLPRLLLSLLVLSVAGCAQPDKPTKGQLAKGVLPGFAFDRYEKVCIANRDNPRQAIISRVFDGRVSNGVFSNQAANLDGRLGCVVTYKPGDLAEARAFLVARSPAWVRPSQTVDCKDIIDESKGSGVSCNVMENAIVVEEFSVQFKNGELNITYWPLDATR